MTYDQTEKTLVSNAQANMISYHQKVLDLELKQKNRELLAATYDSVALKMNNGMATQMDLLTAQGKTFTECRRRYFNRPVRFREHAAEALRYAGLEIRCFSGDHGDTVR